MWRACHFTKFVLGISPVSILLKKFANSLNIVMQSEKFEENATLS